MIMLRWRKGTRSSPPESISAHTVTRPSPSLTVYSSLTRSISTPGWREEDGGIGRVEDGEWGAVGGGWRVESGGWGRLEGKGGIV